MEYTSELCLETIEYLRKAGRKDDSFSEAFPYIHHFKSSGGDGPEYAASMEGFINHCNNHELKVKTNINVCRRLLDIKQQVDDFKSTSSDFSGISSIKFQNFAIKSVEIIPF